MKSAPPKAPTLDSIGERLARSIDGREIYALARRIFPICRSITGEGVRETLHHLQEKTPIHLVEIPSGTEVLDWTVPREWNIRAAYIENPGGERIVDFVDNPLHVLNYSIAVDKTLPLGELKQHVFSLPEQPDLIPYRTSYYAERWGFCMAHRQLASLPDGMYRAVIDATLTAGSLTYGEFFHRGEIGDEVLLSAHICHPGQANDNCSALALLAVLAQKLSGENTRYSYRILFAPGTIGAITWLARNGEAAARIKHGLVLSCLGDGGGPTYKRSRQGSAFIDRAMVHILNHRFERPNILDFFPYGYDERQYCSPGFDLPVGLFQRSQFGTFPAYHTSADNLDFIAPQHLAESFGVLSEAIDIIENDRICLNLSPKGEPQLGRRGLYDALGGDPQAAAKNLAMLWVLNLSDGRHSLLDIAERSGMQFSTVAATAELLQQKGLLSA
jgi:aminopeptidase-like protein